jgi:hypothetical protein
MTPVSIPSELASWISRASVLTAIVTALITVVRRGRNLKLEDLLSRSFAAGALPTGMVLIYCGFDPSVMTALTGLNLHIPAAGLALIYISVGRLRNS